MRSQTLVVTLECAGNGRTLFDRPTEGEKWALGAVSTAEWTGVPLLEILERVCRRRRRCCSAERTAERSMGDPMLFASSAVSDSITPAPTMR